MLRPCRRPIPMKTHFEKIVIIGVGLIGGSLGMAIRDRKLAREVVGVDKDAISLGRAVAAGAVDRVEEELSRAVEGADLVILATPVGRIESLAEALSGKLGREAVVTDVGSVKEPVVAAAARRLEFPERFVGGHPVAGREKSGLGAATRALFAGAACVMTPTANTDPDALRRVSALWSAIGCRVVEMEPRKHDRIFSAVSHLPHIAAFALVTLMLGLEEKEPGLISYAAGGFRDFTRIAASSPEMWRDICLENAEEILGRIDEYQDGLESVKRMIKEGDGRGLEALFARSRSVREKLDPR